ncbi:MAG: ribosomal protein S18-alanine N-acetyltransferase [Firmicutes bacterium]|nr:ribosomal protein S18-alanine N-acetyltransferase [Bacillota bacterium]MCL5038521.1 ribosomal protein S18-alanine N-acetyltransferase [Bacillota bacterium]
MTPEDLDGVMTIEKLSFPTPWSRQAFYTEIMENSYAHYIVARVGKTVIGYAGMWLILDEAHVTNVAVHPDYRGRGVGQALMQELVERALQEGAESMTLEVRVSNLAAQQLYEKLGFEKRGIRRGYYTDVKEDAIIMWKDNLRETR